MSYRKNIKRKKLKKISIKKNIVDYSVIPLEFKHRVEALENRLKPNLLWNTKGEVIMDGVYYPNTNIGKLLHYHAKVLKPKMEPYLYSKFKNEFQ